MAREYSNVEMDNKIEVKKNNKNDTKTSLNLDYENNKTSPSKRICSYCSISIRQNDPWKLYWDSIILAFAIFNSITIPLVLSFEEINETLYANDFFVVIDLMSNIFFIVDIYFQMNTTYYDSDGEEIFQKSKIRKNYFFSSFPIDLLSSLPIELIFPGNVLRILNVLKIIRVLRLTAIINKMNVDEETKSLLRMAQLIFDLVLVMHIVGSLWHYICKVEQLWIPPLDWVHAGQYPKIYRVYNKEDSYQYMVYLYNAVLFLGGNEMGPRTETEILICTIILVVMAIFNAWLFGDMAVLSEMSGRKMAQFQEQIDIANTAMKQMDLPIKFQKQVQEFLIFTQGTKSEQSQLKKFLDMISPSLAEKVSILIFSKVIQKNRRFKTVFLSKQKQLGDQMGFNVDILEIVSMMISKFKTVLREPEDIVVEQFTDTDDMYLIAKGACEVFIVDEKKNRNRIKNLRPGDYFGEISLIYGCKRTASVNSSKYSTLAMLKKVHYKEILIEFPDLQEQLKQSIFRYKDRMKRFTVSSIQKIGYFQDIGDAALHDIIYNLQVKKYQKGTHLQLPGDNATVLYFLQDGVIEIYTKTENDHEFILEKLFRGSIVNFRTFFMEEGGKVYYRFGRNSICSAITIEKMAEILPRHNVLRNKFMKFKK